MIRTGIGILIATGACAMIAAACSDSIDSGVKTTGTGGASSTGGSGTGATGAGGGSAGTGTAGTSNGGGTGASDACTVACCPTDAACYSDPTLKDKSPGADCLAMRNNVGQDHIQLRQSWINATAPLGNVGGIVYQVLSGRSELPLDGMMGSPDCKMVNGPLGQGGYIQIVDYFLKGDDITTHYAVTGFASFISRANVTAALTDGLCMGQETYAGQPMGTVKTDYRLKPKDMSLTTGYGGPAYPEGLPAPQALFDANGQSVPWTVKATKAARMMADFNIQDATQRADILKKLEPTGELGMKGYSGVFFYDKAKGYTHGYSPLTYVIVYGSDMTTHLTIPIREAEPKATFNDPASPNCVGYYGQDPMMTVGGGCKAPTDPNKGDAWGGGNCTGTTGKATCATGEGPASVNGYFLITELQQVFSSDLGVTLCVSYPTTAIATKDGFYDDATKGCVTAKWDPSKADGSGLPKGDWCAATNAAATATCHDAFLSKNFQTFSAAKIKLDSASGEPANCPL